MNNLPTVSLRKMLSLLLKMLQDLDRCILVGQGGEQLGWIK